MALIFILSHQDGKESTEVSFFFCILFAKLVLAFDWSRELIQSLGLGADVNSVGLAAEFCVRKAAHMTEYLILTVLAWRWLTGCCACASPVAWSWIFSVLYACTDEFHQMFIPGRAGQCTDVCVDVVGAALGVAVILLYRTDASKKRSQNT